MGANADVERSGWLVGTEAISQELVQIALDRAEGFPFERFANSFYGSLIGATFVPVGGIKDGGADARDGAIFADKVRPEVYYQASVESDAENKIRRTVNRLREFGRAPKSLTYLTSRTVKHSDRVERDLTDELDVTILIRDGNYITVHLNASSATQAAFDDHLRHYTDYLRQIGASRLLSPSRHVASPAVYVFLAQEMEHRAGDESLVNAMTDALALWALEGTDPDKGILRSAEEVMNRIDAELPGVHTLIKPRLYRRLKVMSKKDYRDGRAVRWHKTEDSFALPFETRRHIADENSADEALRLNVLAGFHERLQSIAPRVDGLGEVGIRRAGEIALRALGMAFEREGLEFSSFLEDEGEHEYPTITECLRNALTEEGVTGQFGQRVGDGAFQILRGVLYKSSETEREYLKKLSRTYALLFTLKTEPKLLEFFQDMTADFRLYVGSDQIIRALSEHYLAKPDQTTRNTLLLAVRAGAKLILTGPALEEVISHFRAADYEHQNHIRAVEDYLTYDFASQAPHIMLRAYLYARLNKDLGRRRPVDWTAFVRQFCDPKNLHKPHGEEELRRYLQILFGFDFESKSDLESLVNPAEVEALTEKLSEVKKDARLARNDALVALAVYGRRNRHREAAKSSEFGWATWWLTSETKILHYTRDFVRANNGRYAMRPEFLLNFLTLAPSATEARQTFATIFPSLLGIQLGRRMNREAFDKIMDRVAEASQLDDARKTVEISKCADILKGDYRRQYVDRLPDSGRAQIDLEAERLLGTAE
ncbi:hypothetical protein AB0P21_37260 [Kribbella sp. NPDC056861]|uniref:hypothetical protein n=1 Tax=Kribbella sp. NPDC056861 TaxID=3154857 RepID=UPI0034290EF6